MFKIEVVAGDAGEMATKLEGLAAIYRCGEKIAKGETVFSVDLAKPAVEGMSKVEEVNPPKKPRGRSAKLQSIDTPAPEQPEEPEAPKEVSKPVTLDAVREAMKKFIDAAAVKSGKEETRREEFKALLDQFGVPKLSELPEAKWQAMIDLAGQKLAAL